MCCVVCGVVWWRRGTVLCRSASCRAKCARHGGQTKRPFHQCSAEIAQKKQFHKQHTPATDNILVRHGESQQKIKLRRTWWLYHGAWDCRHHMSKGRPGYQLTKLKAVHWQQQHLMFNTNTIGGRITSQQHPWLSAHGQLLLGTMFSLYCTGRGWVNLGTTIVEFSL